MTLPERYILDYRARSLLAAYSWRGNRRTHGCSLHLDIKNGKIWIQYDRTEVEIATQLLELGVPKENIVLAFLQSLQSIDLIFCNLATHTELLCFFA